MEGARWDTQTGMIAESRLKELTPGMPVMFIRAIPVDKQDTKNVYECPVYKTRQRGPTYVWNFFLKTKESPAKWSLAGVALLLSAWNLCVYLRVFSCHFKVFTHWCFVVRAVRVFAIVLALWLSPLNEVNFLVRDAQVILCVFAIFHTDTCIFFVGYLTVPEFVVAFSRGDDNFSWCIQNKSWSCFTLL